MVSLDDFVEKEDEQLLLLPPDTRKFKQRIVLRGYTKNTKYVITGIPLIHNETNELVAFVDLKWELAK